MNLKNQNGHRALSLFRAARHKMTSFLSALLLQTYWNDFNEINQQSPSGFLHVATYLIKQATVEWKIVIFFPPE